MNIYSSFPPSGWKWKFAICVEREMVKAKVSLLKLYIHIFIIQHSRYIQNISHKNINYLTFISYMILFIKFRNNMNMIYITIFKKRRCKSWWNVRFVWNVVSMHALTHFHFLTDTLYALCSINTVVLYFI